MYDSHGHDSFLIFDVLSRVPHDYATNGLVFLTITHHLTRIHLSFRDKASIFLVDRFGYYVRTNEYFLIQSYIMWKNYIYIK